VIVAKAGRLFASKSDLASLSIGRTDRSEKVRIVSLTQENSVSQAVGFAEAFVGRGAVRW
jgi:hypothetical protein